MTTTKSKIGIASGIGPLAGADVLTKLFAYAADQHAAHEDDEYPDVLLLNHGIRGVDYTATLNERFKAEIIDMVLQLEKGGATIIGIACNTEHYYLGDIEKVLSTAKIVNLIEAVAQTAGEDHRKPFGLLTSNSTRAQKLYHEYLKRSQVQFIETTDDQQALLDQAIDAVMAHKNQVANRLVEKVINEMKKQHNLTQFIAGCTELPIAIGSNSPKDITLIDSNFVTAKGLADAYYSELE
jgi:aspartate/glutamate racemase